MAIFPTFFLGSIGKEIVFYDILERRNIFLGYKNKEIKKAKNWDVGPKMAIFFNIFF